MNNSKKSLPSIKTKLTNFKGALLKPKNGLIYLMLKPHINGEALA
mgnify:CR=1 FL=1